MYPLIGITVCINYSDFLRNTLPNNIKYFKKYYIITEESDTATIELAKQYKCEIVYFKDKNIGDATFNKSGMIHMTQKKLHVKYPDDWFLILDADILLPFKFSYLNFKLFNKNKLYGITRYDFYTKDNFINLKNAVKYYNSDKEIFGYFQLYFNKKVYYPYWSKNCSQCDLDFQNMFNKNLCIIPFVNCYHFGIKDRNWDGRVVDIFEPICDNIILDTLKKLDDDDFNINPSPTTTKLK